MVTLSRAQQEVLALVERYIHEHGMPPTRAEIADAKGCNRATVEQHLRALAGKGAIEIIPGTYRGLRILRATGARMASVEAGPAARLPLVSYIAAGKPILSSENIEEILDIAPTVFHPRADWLFRVKGESMRRAGILDGDLVGVHEDPDPPTGQIVAALTADAVTGDVGMTLKRLRRRGASIVLLSESDDQERFPPQVYAPRHEPIRLVGVYCGLVRSRPR